ncbi:MAG: SDR family oxidoreductase [Verrucomicrobiota bacterium]|jgi:NAD(P)-dependent dehydrogenase (short-subunit alcohol dehydrogenase family)
MSGVTNPMDLSGKLLIVTGASSGIGRETCRCLSELGARVILVARNREKLAEVAVALAGKDHRIEPFDLTHSDEIPEWLEGIAKSLGPLDGVVHSAGVFKMRLIRDWSLAETDAMMRINLYPCFALAKGLRRRNCHRPGASLVFLSSIAGIKGQPALAIYTATKAAIVGLTRCLALEFAPDGVRVNCVAPALVQTEMADTLLGSMTADQMAKLAHSHPLGLGKPRDVANAIAFLLADTSRWITGTTLITDGGCTA